MVRIVWSTHALRRMRRDAIDLEDVREVIDTGERIEDYPADQPYPTALLLGSPRGNAVHVVAAFAPQDTIIVVTTYRPDPAKWDPDYRRRH